MTIPLSDKSLVCFQIPGDAVSRGFDRISRQFSKGSLAASRGKATRECSQKRRKCILPNSETPSGAERQYQPVSCLSPAAVVYATTCQAGLHSPCRSHYPQAAAAMSPSVRAKGSRFSRSTILPHTIFRSSLSAPGSGPLRRSVPPPGPCRCCARSWSTSPACNAAGTVRCAPSGQVC